MKIVEINPEFKALVDANGGYCPCMYPNTPDTECKCKAFREQETQGPCHCGRYEKVIE